MKINIAKKIISFIIVLTILITPKIYANADTSSNGVAYDIVNMDKISNLSDISVQKIDQSIIINFQYNKNNFSIQANLFNIVDDQYMYNFYDISTKMNYNVLYYNGEISGSITQVGMTPIEQKQNKEQNFCFIISSQKNNEYLSLLLKERATVNAEEINKIESNIESSMFVEPSLDSNQRLDAIPAISVASNSLHVLASGLSIPFLISAGVAEAWATSSYLYADFYNVTNLSYSISYNWPSDGIRLYSDYANGVSAYSTSAFPAAGLTYVSGSWRIDRSIGRIEAVITVSALVKGFPLMSYVYDVQPVG